MQPKQNRRIILIDTRFQLRLAGTFILLQLFLTGLFAVVLYLFMNSELKTGLASAHAAYRSLDQMLLPLVGVLAAFSFVLSTLIVLAFVVILSHRIAGPLFRFRTVLEALSRREIPAHTRLRPDDQLGELSESMERTLATLTTDLESLTSTASALAQARQGQDPEALDRGLAELTRLLAAWKLPLRS